MNVQGVALANVIVKDNSTSSNNALLYVDAGDSSSYPGSGTTWTDLSGNSNTVTLSVSPTFTNAGPASFFAFNGSTQYGTAIASKFNTTYAGKTIIIAARMSPSAWTSGVDQYRCMFGTNATGTGYRNFNIYTHHDTSNNFQFHFSAGPSSGFNGSISSNVSLVANQWFIMAVTHTTGGTLTYYLNGQVVNTNTGITFNQYGTNAGEFVGAGDNYWYGDIGTVSIYGRALSAVEILQSYNTLSAKYNTFVTSNLVAYYNPGINAGYPGSGSTLYDSGGNTMNGTMSNLTYSSPYMTYNGTNSQVSIADIAYLEPGSGSFTVEAWVYYSTIAGSTRTVLAKTDNGGTSAAWSYGIRTLATGSTYLEVGNGTTSISSPAYTVSTGTWYQLVGVWTNSGTKTTGLYVNGVSQGTNTHTFTSVKNSSNPLYFGTYNGGEFSQWLNGRLGIVRYYNTALTSAQILQNFNNHRSTYGL